MRRRSAFLFFAVLPLILLALPALLLGELILLFVGAMALVVPWFGVPALAVGLLTLACLASLAWLWAALVGLVPRRQYHWLQAARAVAIAGCVMAIAVLALALRDTIMRAASNTHLPMAVMGVEALVSYCIAALVLAWWWRSPDARPQAVHARATVTARAIVSLGLIWILIGSAAGAGYVGLTAFVQREATEAPSRTDPMTSESIAVAVCAGRLQEAHKRLATNGARPAALSIVQHCLSKDTNDNRTVLFPERLPVALEAVLVEEQLSGHLGGDCTLTRQHLLDQVVKVDIAFLNTVRQRGLPIDCPSLWADRRPVWWTVARKHVDRPTLMEDLQLLDRLNVDWRRGTRTGTSLFGERPNDFVSKLPADALLYLLDRTKPPPEDLLAVRMDLLGRKLALDASPKDRRTIEELMRRYREPTTDELFAQGRLVFWPLEQHGASRAELAVYLLKRFDPSAPIASGPNSESANVRTVHEILEGRRP